jgi:hypothetical protein
MAYDIKQDVYLPFLLSQITKYGSIIYIKDVVRTKDGAVGVVDCVTVSGEHIPGVNDITYEILADGKILSKGRQDLERLSQAGESRKIETYLKKGIRYAPLVEGVVKVDGVRSGDFN